MKAKYIRAHLEVARVYGELSSAERLKVGCIIVKDDRIISIGYNGMPAGSTNVCEVNNVTKPEVLHAEANAILKCAKHGQSCRDADLYLTLSPCKECSKLIHQAGIKRVIYYKLYKDSSGIDFLQKAGVEIMHLDTV